VSDPISSVEETGAALAFTLREVEGYLEHLDDDLVKEPGAEAAVEKFDTALPEDGLGTMEALTRLMRDGRESAVRSSGPRFFHFVQGGTTPAALAADWFASALDQNPAMWIASPLGAHLEVVAIAWLKELFGLPRDWGGVLTTGAQMANFTGLVAARRWWGLRHGRDVDEEGMGGLPGMPVMASGLIHPTAVKAVSMLGGGRRSVRKLTADDAGHADLDDMRRELERLDGAPAILIATAGEPNAGAFDPIDAMAELAEEFGAWLHVDGAFGLFAALSEETSSLTYGVERAHSVISDGHKWLNVPYDCGFAFVRDPSLLPGAFSSSAAYLAPAQDARPNSAYLSPESSRRARSLAVWATLSAYGRSGYRAMVERHVGLAARLAKRVDASEDLERLAEATLNIVCFRYHPPGIDDEATLNELNAELGRALLEDGRVYVGTTTYAGKTALRPAIVNWRTTEDDVDLIIEVVRELGARML
jgi:glutamate/tyrosine decarboxylase-like PLP-dependent enzyme